MWVHFISPRQLQGGGAAVGQLNAHQEHYHAPGRSVNRAAGGFGSNSGEAVAASLHVVDFHGGDFGGSLYIERHPFEPGAQAPGAIGRSVVNAGNYIESEIFYYCPLNFFRI